MHVVAALAILLTWAIVAIVFIGIGSLALIRFDRAFLLRDAFWLGFGVSVAFLELWNLLWPVGATSTILCFAAGVAGLIVNHAALLSLVKKALHSAHWSLVCGFALLLFLALRASGPCDYFDTGLYGSQAVRWISSYPVVPGLANVHGRLGFNSSVFLCIAALGQGAWKGLAFHLFTGFVISAIGFTLLLACSRLLREYSTSPADWFYSILAIPLIAWAFRSPIVGTQTDEPATIACMVGAGMLFEDLCRETAQEDRSGAQARLVVAASTFALAVTFKETTAIFAFLAWCLTLHRICFRNQSSANRNLCLAGSLAISALIVLPWLVRGILLSGYPFFPLASFGFPVDWRTPLVVTKWYGAGALSFARMPNVELADTRGFAWLRPWLHSAIHDRSAFQVPVFIALSGLAAVLFSRIRKKGAVYPWMWMLVPSLVGGVFWLLLSPAFRFGQAPIWTAAATLGTWGVMSLTSGPRRMQLSRTLLAGLGVLLVWCVVNFGWMEPYRRLFATPPLAPLPEALVTARKTQSGLMVFVPNEKDQCWDAPLPCTPYFDETLRLRNPSSLRFGFTSKSAATQLPRFEVSSASEPSALHRALLYSLHALR